MTTTIRGTADALTRAQLEDIVSRVQRILWCDCDTWNAHALRVRQISPTLAIDAIAEVLREHGLEPETQGEVMDKCTLTQWDYNTARNHTLSCGCNICTHAHCPDDSDCRRQEPEEKEVSK